MVDTKIQLIIVRTTLIIGQKWTIYKSFCSELCNYCYIRFILEKAYDIQWN